MSAAQHRPAPTSKPWRGIVKVQLSLATTHDAQRAFIYSEDHILIYECNADDALKTILKGRAKAYFEASLIDTSILLGDEVAEPDW